jgi:hypothetical protein
MKKNQLRWLIPNDCFYGDTGLGNRLLHLEIAFEINKKNNLKFDILLDDLYWRESKLLTLPNSFIISHKDEIVGNPIDKEMIEDIFNNKNVILDDGTWYPNFGFKSLSSFKNINVIFNPLSLIRLSNPHIEDYIRNKMKNVVGIHIRRNMGVYYTDDDVDSLPEYLREKYLKLRFYKKIEYNGYNFIQDDYYFNIIDNILKINPNQKFFISTDLPYEFISYYKQKYGDIIITKENLISDVRYFLKYDGTDIDEVENFNTLHDVIDLFSLSFCKFLIVSNVSTWSDFAKRYRNQPWVFATDDWDSKIKNKYINNNWDQSCDFLFYNKNLKTIL